MRQNLQVEILGMGKAVPSQTIVERVRERMFAQLGAAKVGVRPAGQLRRWPLFDIGDGAKCNSFSNSTSPNLDRQHAGLGSLITF